MPTVYDDFETETVLGYGNRIKRKNILFRTTLDIDTNDKKIIEHHVNKIINCPFLFHLHKKPSATKGFHFILKCLKDCDICRICFDDFRRYNYDMNRPIWARNILFDRSERIYE